MVKIDFELGERPMLYRDALHLPDDHGLTAAEIEAMKRQRYENWLAGVNAEPAAAEPDYIEVDGVRYVRAQPDG